MIGWSLGLAVYAFVMGAVFTSIHMNPMFEQLVKNYPEALKSLFQISDYTTGVGYMRVEVVAVVAPLLVVTFGILWGGDLLAGEEDRGTLDLLLANPISRGRVLLEKLAALVVGMVVASGGLTIGLLVGSPLFDLNLGVSACLATGVAIALLGLLFGTLALTLGAATGSRGVARGLTVLVVVVAYLVSGLADLVTWLKPVRPLSPWYHALATDPLGTGWHPWHLAVLVGITVVIALLGVVSFDRRDLST